MNGVSPEWWFLISIYNARTESVWYEMMSNITLEERFQWRGEYYQHHRNAHITAQIQEQSRDISVIARALQEVRKNE